MLDATEPAMATHIDPEQLATLTSADHLGPFPAFAKSLGMDFIITPESGIILLELQLGFGRRGLRMLFPFAGRTYRRTYHSLLHHTGRSYEVSRRLRPICSNKINTYKAIPQFQPSSFVYRGWTLRLEHWLDSLDSELVIAKPPCGVCGRGIRVLPREGFLRDPEAFKLEKPMILQQFIESRRIDDDGGRPHVGCIRHVSIMHSDTHALDFIHLPSYWRVAPTPFVGISEREGLTANISRGAYPVALTGDEGEMVRAKTEEIGLTVIRQVLEVPEIDLGRSWTIAPEGELLGRR
jgi:hypothetical protein